MYARAYVIALGANIERTAEEYAICRVRKRKYNVQSETLGARCMKVVYVPCEIGICEPGKVVSVSFHAIPSIFVDNAVIFCVNQVPYYPSQCVPVSDDGRMRDEL